MSINWSRFQDVIHASRNVVLVSHIRPDCDALGSELGMAGILRALGKRVRIVNGQATPPNLQFIDPRNEIKAIQISTQPEELGDVDLYLILDTSAKVQLGPMYDVIQTTSAKVIILDHHVSDDELGAEAFRDTTSEATGCLVVEAARQLGVALTPEMATPLFAAVATDTGWFRFGSVRSGTYQVAAELVAAGASPATIYADLYEQETAGRLRLRGVVLSRIEVELNGRMAHTFIRLEDYAKTGALPSDTEDLVNEVLKIKGTEFAVIMVEQKTGGFKLSFRSRCAAACNEIAGHFGGGGHRAAAGALIVAPYEEVVARVLPFVRAQLEALPPTA
ncbi:MAG: DHH family phosphoesterase [Planctomycetota bacterium]